MSAMSFPIVRQLMTVAYGGSARDAGFDVHVIKHAKLSAIAAAKAS